MSLKRDGNVAFKCAWNNKGYKTKCDGCPPGVTPTCSERRIHVHPELPESCWEMNLFNIWEFGSGDNRSIKDAKKDKVAIFTTKMANSDHRSVMAVTRIKDIRRHELGSCPHGTFWSDIVVGDPELSVKMPIDINFEDFYQRSWRQGLFRYLQDDKVRTILLTIKSKLATIEVSPNARELMDRLIALVS